MEENFISLYDYLGNAAGPSLGYRIATIARKANIEIKTKPAPDHSPYSRDINLYPISFLKKVLDFSVKINEESVLQIIEESKSVLI